LKTLAETPQDRVVYLPTPKLSQVEAAAEAGALISGLDVADTLFSTYLLPGLQKLLFRELNTHGPPLYVRGVTVSLAAQVVLSPEAAGVQQPGSVAEKPWESRVLRLSDVLLWGGADDFTADTVQVVPLLSPESFNNPGFRTLGEELLQRTARQRARVIERPARAWLFPTLLVYRPDAVGRTGGSCEVGLPRDAARRAECILKAYVLDYVHQPSEILGRPH
jgi:hypothetical protein